MLFDAPELQEAELAALAELERLRTVLRHQVAERKRWTGLLRRVAMARAVQGSNSIEGYAVTLDEAIALEAGEEPLDVERDTRLAIQGYRAAMDYVLQLASDPHFAHSEALVRSLHFLVLRHDLTKGPGLYRPGAVYVNDERTGAQLYEGPDARVVPALVDELVTVMGDGEEPAVVRGAMAHLNLAMIHPFRDGNGRMARILQSLVLAREGILAAEFASIEEELGRETAAYYSVLAEVGGARWQPDRDARPWLRFCLRAHLRQAARLLRRLEESAALWELVEDQARRAGLPRRSVAALCFAAPGRRLRNSSYLSLTADDDEDLTVATASRDLRALVDAGLLVAHGEKRGRTYTASEALRALREEARRAAPELPDPFPISVTS